MQSSFICLINSDMDYRVTLSRSPIVLSDLSMGNNIAAAFSLLDTTERKGLSTCLKKIYSCSFPVEFFFFKCLPFWYLLVCFPALSFFKPIKWASKVMGFIVTFSHICIISLCFLSSHPPTQPCIPSLVSFLLSESPTSVFRSHVSHCLLCPFLT